MALISYTMIGASLVPAFIVPFFWKKVSRTAGVASMITVLLISTLNRIVEKKAYAKGFLGKFFPLEADYIAIPALIISLTTLLSVSLMTSKPPEEIWKPSIE